MPTRSRSFTCVHVARPAAVGLVRARREDRAEHAVLHVEHRHVLVDDDFEPRGRHGVDQVEQLLAVQVVRGGHPLGAARAQVVDRQFIGRVEREVGDERNAVLAAETPGRPGCGRGSRRPRAWPARGRCPSRRAFESAAWRGRSCAPCAWASFDGCAILADVAEIGEQLVDRQPSMRGFELIERAAEDAQAGPGVEAPPLTPPPSTAEGDS